MWFSIAIYPCVLCFPFLFLFFSFLLFLKSRSGSNAKEYFSWSFLDVLELLYGWESGYGLYYVNLDDPDLKRYPKLSAHWYSGFLKGDNIHSDEAIGIQKNKTPVSSVRSIQ